MSSGRLPDAYAARVALKCAQPYADTCTYKGEHYTATWDLSHGCDRPSGKRWGNELESPAESQKDQHQKNLKFRQHSEGNDGGCGNVVEWKKSRASVCI